MALPDLGLENETWMPLFWLCNIQGQREVYRTFSVPVNVSARLHVSCCVTQSATKAESFSSGSVRKD